MKLLRPNLLSFLGWNTQGDLGPFTFYTTKKHKTVWFPKAPPTKPPTYLQIVNRTRFKLIAQFWQRLSVGQRATWEQATIELKLNLTGYNLFTWYYAGGDRETIATIERLADLTLIDD